MICLLLNFFDFDIYNFIIFNIIFLKLYTFILIYSTIINYFFNYNLNYINKILITAYIIYMRGYKTTYLKL